MEISIGELSRRTGVKAPTIRYYEFGRPDACTAPQRRQTTPLFGASSVHAHFYSLRPRIDFEIDAVRTLLALQDNPNQPCTTADRIARARLAEVERRILSLTALKAELELMIKGFRLGNVATCRVIEVLADHGQCAHDKH